MTPTAQPAIPDAAAGETFPQAPRRRPSGSQLGFALLGYLLGVTLIITLLPFQFARPQAWRVLLGGTVLDAVANILLFLPLGFLFRLATAQRHRHSTMVVLWIGALLSTGIELAQLFEIERYTSPLDVVANAFGAWIGAALSDRSSRRLERSDALVGRLSLELPLMGLLYLMVPLLWLNALASSDAREHALLALLVGAAGATVAGGVQRYHLRSARGIHPVTSAALTAGWFLAGSFPLVRHHALVVVAGTGLVGAVTWYLGRQPVEAAGGRERRYEVPVLLSCLPAFAVYVACLGAGPLLGGVDRWVIGVGFPGVASEWTRVEILRLLELVAAFTLGGYAVAEHRGRVFQDYRLAARRIAAFSIAGALVVEGLRGFHAGHGASVARAVVLIGAGLYGGWLYYLQRRQVVRLLEGTRAALRTTDPVLPAIR